MQKFFMRARAVSLALQPPQESNLVRRMSRTLIWQLHVSERILRNFAVVLCFLAVAPVTALGQNLAPGPGADTVTQACQKCHGLGPITSQHHDLDAWRTIIAQMISNGAILSDEDADQIAKYLASNYGVQQSSGAAPTASAAPGSTPPESR
jgi:hypothetical protein